MQTPVEVVFLGMQPSEFVEERIRQKVEALKRYYDRILGCRVVLELPHRHQRSGKLFHVKIILRVPGREIVVNREPTENQANEDPYIAVKNAFKAAKRQLMDHSEERRRKVKGHDDPVMGRVSQLFYHEGYGFLETPDGREIFFHKNSVATGSFDKLEIGTMARFSEGPGDRGPQATSLHPVA